MLYDNSVTKRDRVHTNRFTTEHAIFIPHTYQSNTRTTFRLTLYPIATQPNGEVSAQGQG